MNQHAALIDHSKMSYVKLPRIGMRKKKTFINSTSSLLFIMPFNQTQFSKCQTIYRWIKRVRQFVTASARTYIDNQNTLFEQLASFRVLLNSVVCFTVGENLFDIFLHFEKNSQETQLNPPRSCCRLSAGWRQLAIKRSANLQNRITRNEGKFSMFIGYIMS